MYVSCFYRVLCRLLTAKLRSLHVCVQNLLGAIPEINFDELNNLIDRVNAFEYLHGEELKDIRNAVTAHREHDPLQQIEVIEKIDTEIFLGHFAIIYKLSMDINFYLSKLLEAVEAIE